jgi:hypothetical protein
MRQPLQDNGPDIGGGNSGPSPTWAAIKAFFTLPSTGLGSCIQVALDAAQEPLQAVHELVHPLEENLAPLAPMVQSPMPANPTAIAAELWSMTTGAAVATGRGPIADDFRSLVQQASLILAGTAAAATQYVAPIVQAVERNFPVATAIAVETVGAYAVVKEEIAASRGQCKP